jgi:hypothetical protein
MKTAGLMTKHIFKCQLQTRQNCIHNTVLVQKNNNDSKAFSRFVVQQEICLEQSN